MTRVLAALMMCVAIAGCPRNESVPAELRLTAMTYYEAERVRDWETTWNLRTPQYRRIQPLDTYAAQMQQDSEAWELESITIVKSHLLSSGAAVLYIEFLENPNDSARRALGLPPGNGIVKFTEPTEWTKEPEGWRCKACGGRAHFVMNSSP